MLIPPKKYNLIVFGETTHWHAIFYLVEMSKPIVAVSRGDVKTYCSGPRFELTLGRNEYSFGMDIFIMH